MVGGHDASSGESALDAAPDAVLALRSADGDSTAFGVLVRRHISVMRAYAWRLTGSQADASDAVQEALITIWRKLPELEDPDRVRGWMMRIVSSRSFDLIRARRPHDDIIDVDPADRDDSGPERRAESSSAMRALAAALRQLPETQRQCWVLREVGGESYDEIAEHLGTTTAAVRGALARARATLVTTMEEWR
ncbi:sigma-70 family RNA polymerase sigma factor [Agromyces atrinae]|uniref:RNA polymerase sigma factor n=1 Tax=Agromyces atrinae TaxID=592376 RepID=UPI001F56F070|nr:sigma-70 family RNA polymerase sigma factor [Agromyces atrinae]MCI2957258.1 sigma-70 family RNA polymerase sigma factor [Agromyces atrinae]